MVLSNKDEHTLLYSGKKFELWEDCESFINEWAKQQDFRLIKDWLLMLEIHWISSITFYYYRTEVIYVHVFLLCNVELSADITFR